MPGPALPSAHERFEMLLARAFPDLTEAERAVILRASEHVARWIERLPRDLPYEEEPAQVFIAPEPAP